MQVTAQAINIEEDYHRVTKSFKVPDVQDKFLDTFTYVGNMISACQAQNISINDMSASWSYDQFTGRTLGI